MNSKVERTERGKVNFLRFTTPPETVTETWLPSYRDLKRFRIEQLNYTGKFKWVCDLNGNPCDPGNKSQIVDEVPADTFYPERFCPEGDYHYHWRFWTKKKTALDHRRHCQEERVEEVESYRKYSEPHLWYHAPSFDVIMDSKLRHPSSHFAYSAIRVDRTKSRHHRKHFYCKNWEKYWPIMGQTGDLAMTLGHNLIIMEPTCMGRMTMRRLMFGTYITYACLALSFISVWSAHTQPSFSRYPSFYVFPCALVNYLVHNLEHEYSTDPVHPYSFWTNWTNDPADSECFRHVFVPPHLLREERMTFMQIEDHGFRHVFCNTLRYWCSYYTLKALFRRIKYRDSAGDIAWEVLKRKLGATTGRGIYHILGPRNHRCTYIPEAGFFERLFSWTSFGLILTFFVFKYARKLKRVFDEKTRLRLKINEYTFRALKGERRYLRMVEPMYWEFRNKYPRDDMGVRDFWFGSQRHRHTPASHQFYF